ncbi:ComF family protein, partial [candidate division KSB1 bacterium]|nr:ComF family protein [candidate division KSB1 bacterium]
MSKVTFSPILYKRFKPYIDAVLDFLYPAFCLNCAIRLKSGDGLVCEDCWQALPRINSDAQSEIPHVSQSLAVWEFGEELQQIVHEFKFFGKKSLAGRMGDEMAKLASCSPGFSSADLILPVPLHKIRMRERGYNQSLLLAQRIARTLGIPCIPTILKRERYTQTQSKLNIEQRT